jgi:hypothetical protein
MTGMQGPLQPGVEVQLGQHMFRVLDSLGSGSFSTVWTAARLDGGGEVAIKETLCRSHEELQDAENEAKILQMVGNASKRHPGFVACETLKLASGIMSVRLGMAKVAGDSLGGYLQQWKQVWVGDPSSQFAEACNFSHELLVQLVPSMDAISAVAMHRDINTHNVMVSAGHGSSNPQFSVIDFGLAMTMQNWNHMCSKTPVVGDCRYWPVSAWYIFAHGGPKLMEKQALYAEYMTQVDLHAFGLTTLQVFMDMLPQHKAPHIPTEVWGLKVAWEKYWMDAYRLWEPLYKAFERKTDWNQLRQSYIQMEAHNIIDKALRNLRRALFNARDACACAEPGSIVAKAAVIFSACVELISQGAQPMGPEAAKGNIRLTSWRDVADMLNRSGMAVAPLGRRPSTNGMAVAPSGSLGGSLANGMAVPPFGSMGGSMTFAQSMMGVPPFGSMGGSMAFAQSMMGGSMTFAQSTMGGSMTFAQPTTFPIDNKMRGTSSAPFPTYQIPAPIRQVSPPFGSFVHPATVQVR